MAYSCNAYGESLLQLYGPDRWQDRGRREVKAGMIKRTSCGVDAARLLDGTRLKRRR